jgi:serine/threonine protein phosphatase 1
LTVPPGSKLYIVGDIHGRLDKLDELHRLIQEDVRQSPTAEIQVVYLGDYIDRGPDSAGVLQRLIDRPLGDLPTIHLMGNHEEMLLRFLDRPESGTSWFAAGAASTVASYGLTWRGGGGLAAMAAELRDAIPPAHHEFLDELKLFFYRGDVFCVHAGIRPGTAIAKQKQADLLWIRQPFLNSSSRSDVLVIHGHTPTPNGPEVRHNRIGIDTGAYYTGVLTCLVLSHSEQYFLSTEGDGNGI